MTVGIALALSVVAFVLALWPAVTDAPWEAEPVIVQPVQKTDAPSQATICLQLLDTPVGARGLASPLAGAAWNNANCDEFFAGFGK